MTSPLAEVLETGAVVLDGGLSTHLETMGFDLSGELWSARLLTERPEAIADAHADFFAAGAQVATTATYQASFEGFASFGLDRDAAAELMRRGVAIAVEARDSAAEARDSAAEARDSAAEARDSAAEARDSAAEARDKTGGLRDKAAGAAAGGVDRQLNGENRWVAASVGPFGAMLADGSEYRGEYGVSEGELRRWHRERLAVFSDSGADVLAVETLPNAAEVRAVIPEIADQPLPAWICVTGVVVDGVPCTRAGEPLSEVFRLVREVPQVIAVGVNCCDPRDVAAMVAAVTDASGKPGVVYPNQGEEWDGVTKRWVGEKQFHPELVRAWRAAGARLVGGCCRVEPAAIAAIAAELNGG